MNSTAPELTYELSDFIREGKDSEVSISTTSYVLNINDTIINTFSIFDTYMDFIIEKTVLVSLTEEEQGKYMYDPKLLSLDLYGTMELWFLILKLNRCSSMYDFKPKNIKILHPDNIDIINKIMSLNERRLEKSKNNLDIDYEYKV